MSAFRVVQRQKPVEEFPIALERLTKILCRGFFSPSPLLLEPRACLGEAGRETVDNIRHEGVGFL